MNKPQPARNNEKGFASLVVALIMIIVLSLLMVGFARLARREQQNSLDKQLATQAYYAAESGINDLTKGIPAMKTYLQNPLNSIDPNICLTPDQIDAFGLPLSNIDGSNSVSYTCALVNLTPDSLIRNGLGANSAWSTNFSTTGILRSMKVSWGSHDGHYAYRDADDKKLPSFDQWGNAPAVLQFSITPIDSVVSRDGLINSTFTTYLYPSKPSTGGGVAHYLPATNPANNALIASGDCAGNSGYTCNVTVDNLPGSLGTYYMVRILGYYDSSDISINTFRDVGGSHLNTVDGQAQLDVTGRAKNVLKRLQIRTPLGSANDQDFTLPSAAIEAQSTCKRMSTYPGFTGYETPSSYDNSTNGPCHLDTIR